MRWFIRALWSGYITLTFSFFVQADQGSPAALGKRIYHRGDGAQNPIRARLQGSDVDLPGDQFPCGNCHGSHGEGKSEGGLRPPSIAWRVLSQASTSISGRPAYDELSFRRAVRDGISSSGSKLNAGMPRYQMNDAQWAAVLSYLKIVGTDEDSDPGISATAITIGAALPLSGSLAQIGADVAATLRASFAAVNVSGGIYGRRLELALEDTHGTAVGALEATRRLIETQRIFALVASAIPGNNNDIFDYVAQQEIPLIGPLVSARDTSTEQNHYVFYLLPSFADQARVLVDYLMTQTAGGEKPKPNIAVVLDNTPSALDALGGLKSQSESYGIKLATIQQFKVSQLVPDNGLSALVQAKPDCIFYFGEIGDLGKLVQRMQQRGFQSPILSFASSLGAGVFDLPGSTVSQLILAHPTPLPSEERFYKLSQLLLQSKARLNNPAFQALAYADAQIVIETAKRIGRRIDRLSLLEALDHLRDFDTDILPPLNFSANERNGARGAAIVRIDPTKKVYLPVVDWRVPRNIIH